MTHAHILLEDLMELINQNGGIDVFAEAMSQLMNVAMQAERADVLAAEPYERTPERLGYANGFKPKTLRTRLGEVPVKVPQVRGDIAFYPSALEKGTRTERALTLAVAEMYIQGVSTRKVKPILEQLSGMSLSSSSVSKATAQLDSILSAWRTRDLGGQPTPYLILDARYEKARVDGVVRDVAVLIAVGVRADGRRTILGESVSLSEAEVHWRAFLKSLQERGLHGMRMITSDDHAGLKAARKAVMGSIPWQRCQFHLQQNAAAHVSKQSMRGEVAEEIRDVFAAPDGTRAEARLECLVEKYAEQSPLLASWLAENLLEGFTVFSIPRAHQKRLRTSNWLENLNGKLKKRTAVVGVFPSIAAVERLVTAMLMEKDETWITAKRYLTMNPDEN